MRVLAALLLAGCGTSTGALYAPCPTVRVSEVMTANNNYELVDADWFQLENFGDAEVDLSGFLLGRRKTAYYQVPEGVVLPARGFQLFLGETYSDAGDTGDTGDEEDWVPGDALSTGFDFTGDARSELLQLLGRAADGYLECDEVEVPASHRDYSYQLDPDIVEYTGEPEDWCFASVPTPFGANEACL